MLANLMWHTVTIKRPTMTRDGSGGISEAETTLHSSIAANVQPVSAAYEFFYQQRNISVTHSIYTTVDVSNVQTEDTVEYDGRTFIIKGMRNAVERDRVFVLDVYEYL